VVSQQDKIKGMFLGIAVGDSLGLPYETMTEEEIREKAPNGVRELHEPKGHKWFDGWPAGMWTDDTQLSLAIANALIEKKTFDMHAIANQHVLAFKNPKGWGPTTREAIQRIRDGVHWSKSATTSAGKKVRGLGNGVCMKIAPLAAYHYLTNTAWKQIVAETEVFARMTHNTSMGISSGLAQSAAVRYCLAHTPESFKPAEFTESVVKFCEVGRTRIPVRHGEDDLSIRLRELARADEYQYNSIIEAFGKGTCYVFNSLPFSLMFFLKDYGSAEALYRTVEAGGDTDTNGSMVAALLGALHGFEIFPPALLDKLHQRELLCGTAAEFIAAFPMENTDGRI